MVRSRFTEFDLFRAPRTEPVADVRARDRVAVQGVVTALEIGRWAPGTPSLEATITDATGSLTVSFLGRTRVAGVEVGRFLTVAGAVVPRRGRLTIMNPYLWLTADDVLDEPSLLVQRTPAFT